MIGCSKERDRMIGCSRERGEGLKTKPIVLSMISPRLTALHMDAHFYISVTNASTGPCYHFGCIAGGDQLYTPKQN